MAIPANSRLLTQYYDWYLPFGLALIVGVGRIRLYQAPPQPRPLIPFCHLRDHRKGLFSVLNYHSRIGPKIVVPGRVPRLYPIGGRYNEAIYFIAQVGEWPGPRSSCLPPGRGEQEDRRTEKRLAQSAATRSIQPAMERTKGLHREVEARGSLVLGSVGRLAHNIGLRFVRNGRAIMTKQTIHMVAPWPFKLHSSDCREGVFSETHIQDPA